MLLRNIRGLAISLKSLPLLCGWSGLRMVASQHSGVRDILGCATFWVSALSRFLRNRCRYLVAGRACEWLLRNIRCCATFWGAQHSGSRRSRDFFEIAAATWLLVGLANGCCATFAAAQHSLLRNIRG
jgi:hypothetical protein